MARVEADFELFARCQKKNQSTDAYYKVFTLTVDTINANKGMVGWHPKLFKIHREATMVMQEMEIAQMGAPAATEERIRIKEEASKSACAEYLACLFLLLADDERFKTLKKTLNNNFLLRRQEYPKDVLASKRLMTDFDPDVATGTKRTQEQVQPTDMAFVESGVGNS